MKSTLQYFHYLAISVIVTATLGTAHAQNVFVINPSGFQFINATMGGSPQQTQFTLATTSGASVPFTWSVGAGAPWLSVLTSANTTPATIFLVGDPSKLPAGSPPVNLGSVTFSSNSFATLFVAVVLTVNVATPLTSNPVELAFNSVAGGTLPPAQTVSVTSASPIPYTVQANMSWITLGAGSTSGQTPGTITVGVDPSKLTPQNVFAAAVTITPTNGLPPLVIPVAYLYSGSAQLNVAPASLTFNYQIGGTSNTTQKTVSLSGGAFSFTASASGVVNGQQWLSVSPPSGAAPATLTVSVNAAGLPAGQYTGTVTISAPSASNPTQMVAVTLNVSTSPLLDLSPSSLSFSYSVGGALPAAQTITPNSTTPGLNYTVTTNTGGSGQWLNVNITNATTPNPVSVSVTPVGLPAGTYNGTVTFNAVNGGNNPQNVSVTLTVTNNPTLSATPSNLLFTFEVGGSNNSTGSQTVNVTSSGAALSFTPTATQNNTTHNITWLLTSGQTQQTTPASFNVSVSPSGLDLGTYTGTISLAVTGAANPVSVQATLIVSAAGTPLLNATPLALTFNLVQGTTSQPQQVTVTSTGEALPYTTGASAAWISASAANGTPSGAAPSNFFVTVLPANLPNGGAVGTYTGNVTVQPSNMTPPVTVAVTLNVTAGNLTVSSGTLNFTQNAGGPAPQAQTVNVGSSGGQLTISTIIANASNTQWLTATLSSTTTPAVLTVSVNGASLAAGTYNGQINIVSPAASNSPQTVTVNLTVNPAQNLMLSTNALTFTSQQGSAAPQPQVVALTASNGSLAFTTSATVAAPQGGTWLSVAPPSGTATASATNLSVSVNPANLNPGSYTGSVVVQAANASNSPQTINVTYVITAIPTPAPGTIVNLASQQPGPIAPGEIIGISGTNMGPATGVSPPQASPGALYPTLFSEAQVTFDGLAAPLTFVSATRIICIVPYGIAGRAQTRLIVTYKNTSSPAIVLNVASAAPGIFPSNLPGVPATQAAVVNANGSLNSPANPAAKGSEIALFGTGEGQTSPQGVDGLAVPLDSLRHAVQTVQVLIGGQPAEVKYQGSAPTLVSGLFQFNAVIPDSAPSGGAVAVTLIVGGINSPATATMAIQ